MRDLKIARDFALPLNAVTEVIAVLATRGAGKSFASADVVEELYASALQFVVIDPMGVYWGLRSSYDGTKAGLKIIMLGGEQGDVPLEPTSGRLIADVVVDSGQSFVIDLSLFDSKAEQVRFMEAFCERLFFRKGPLDKRTPLMLVIDEADEFAPQKPEKDETKMLGHMIRLAKRGRTRGIGLLTLTQRAAEFHKAILNLSSAVLFMRTAGPHDRREIKKWMAGSAPDLIALVDEAFPKLETGHALVYSPHWLKLEQPREIKFRMIRTFDSYKTPEPGELRATPQAVAQIDLKTLGAQIAATVERQKANDPKELRQMNAELTARLAEAEASLVRLDRAKDVTEARVERVVEKIEVPVFAGGEIEHLAEIVLALRGVSGDLAAAAASIEQAVTKSAQELVDRVHGLDRLVKEVTAGGSREVRGGGTPRRSRDESGAAREQRSPRVVAPIGDQAEGITGPQQKILNALAWWASIGVDRPTRLQVAFVAGYSHSQSRGFRDPLYALNAGELVHYPEPKTLALTDAGRQLAVPPSYDPTERELQEMVYGLIGTNRAKMLRTLVENHYPDGVSREQLAEELGYSHAQSRGFRDPLYKLHALELVAYPSSGMVVAEPVMFLEGAYA